MVRKKQLFREIFIQFKQDIILLYPNFEKHFLILKDPS